MNCKAAGKHIEQYAEGCLRAETASEVKSHLASCGKCASELKAYRKLLNFAAEIRVSDPGKEFWDNYLPNLREKLSAPAPWYNFLKKPLTASVSVVLLLLIVLAPLAAGRISRAVRVRKASAASLETVMGKISSNHEWFAAAIEEYQLASDASNVSEVLSSEEKDRLVAEMTAELMD